MELILFSLLLLLVFVVEFVVLLSIERKIRAMPKNKVHFYVARDKNGDLWLYLGKPFRGDTEFYTSSKVFCFTCDLSRFGLKYEDFDSLKWEDEPVEVFLNMEE